MHNARERSKPLRLIIASAGIIRAGISTENGSCTARRPGVGVDRSKGNRDAFSELDALGASDPVVEVGEDLVDAGPGEVAANRAKVPVRAEATASGGGPAQIGGLRDGLERVGSHVMEADRVGVGWCPSDVGESKTAVHLVDIELERLLADRVHASIVVDEDGGERSVVPAVRDSVHLSVVQADNIALETIVLLALAYARWQSDRRSDRRGNRRSDRRKNRRLIARLARTRNIVGIAGLRNIAGVAGARNIVGTRTGICIYIEIDEVRVLGERPPVRGINSVTRGSLGNIPLLGFGNGQGRGRGGEPHGQRNEVFRMHSATKTEGQRG